MMAVNFIKARKTRVRKTADLCEAGGEHFHIYALHVDSS